MKVYVVVYDDGSDRDDLVGIYSSEEKAREKISRYGAADRDCMHVTEYTVDED